MIVTRFAPSPTGALHVGGARTALFNWAFAKRHGGRFLLRIEDTDQARSSDAMAEAIMRDLRWLGIEWDNPGTEPRQSKRLAIYNQHIERLLKSGAAYEHERAVRFRMPRRDITVHDLVLGDVTTAAGMVEDFVIRKADGFPTYHFAVVIDDADMSVTHVIRGQEHLNNTPKHWALQEALGLPHPAYAHIPLIFNPDGSKMSKRDKAKAARAARTTWIANGHAPDELDAAVIDKCRALRRLDPDLPVVQMNDLQQFWQKNRDDEHIAFAVSLVLHVTLPEIEVADFHDSGYLPEALCNYLALLGWNPGNDVERFDNDYLAKNFSLERVGKSNAKFDREKLRAFNGAMIREMTPEQFRTKLYKFSTVLLNAFRSGPDDPRFVKFAAAYQERSATLKDPEVLGRFFFFDVEYDEKAFDKILIKGEAFDLLGELETVLREVEPWNAETIESALKAYAERKGIGMGKVAQPLRVAVSGGTVSPGIGDTLEILCKDKTLRRIQNCQRKILHR